MRKSLIEEIAGRLQAIKNCVESGNQEWGERHTDEVKRLVKEYLPSGGGFDSGTRIAVDSEVDRIVFYTSFHHMTYGTYSGWTEHKITVRPSFVWGTELNISGPNRNDIKEYISQTFRECLDTPGEVGTDHLWKPIPPTPGPEAGEEQS